ncbi:MAG: SDR family NAD(P)-dependent oxidoreductase [Burkholderiaceae bacterium]
MTTDRDRHVLVTGASRGLGAALCAELLARGYRVTGVARSADELRRRRDALPDAQRARADWRVCDLADPAATVALVQDMLHRGDAPDVLINNAGAGAFKPLLEWSDHELADCVHLNLLAPMLLARAVLPGMIERRHGTIVNIASDLARRPLANMAPYVAAKHGLLGFSASLLREVKAHGIKVSTVLPGIIDTAFGGATPGSKDEARSLQCDALASRIADLLELPGSMVIDELTIHPLHQEF